MTIHLKAVEQYFIAVLFYFVFSTQFVIWKIYQFGLDTVRNKRDDVPLRLSAKNRVP